MFKKIVVGGVFLILIVWLFIGINSFFGFSNSTWTQYVFSPIAVGGAVVMFGFVLAVWLKENI